MMDEKNALASATSLLGSVVPIAGATFFMSFLLEDIYPSATRILGVPFLLVGGFGLALFSLGIGSMLIRAGNLYMKTRQQALDGRTELVSALLRSVFEVIFGLAVLLLYVFFAR